MGGLLFQAHGRRLRSRCEGAAGRTARRELWESHPFDSPGDCTIVSRSAWIEEATRIAGDVGAIHVSRGAGKWVAPSGHVSRGAGKWVAPSRLEVGGPVRSLPV